MGLVSIIMILMAGVGFITFGFTEAVCGTPADRFHGGAVGESYIGTSSITIHGYDYDMNDFKHPQAGDMFDGSTNPVLTGGWNLGGNDATFLFQKVNEHCYGMITKAASSSITGDGDFLDWYFPCNVRSQFGTTTPNTTAGDSSTNCHVSSKGQLSSLTPQGQVYWTWDDLHNSSRSLAVFERWALLSYFSRFPLLTAILKHGSRSRAPAMAQLV